MSNHGNHILSENRKIRNSPPSQPEKKLEISGSDAKFGHNIFMALALVFLRIFNIGNWLGNCLQLLLLMPILFLLPLNNWSILCLLFVLISDRFRLHLLIHSIFCSFHLLFDLVSACSRLSLFSTPHCTSWLKGQETEISTAGTDCKV